MKPVRIHETEDGRTCANAQSQRQHDSEREARRAAQLPQRIANIPTDIVHRSSSATAAVDAYSVLKACMGSIDAARCAGIRLATAAHNPSTTLAPVKAQGS